jgi:peroxin-6
LKISIPQSSAHIEPSTLLIEPLTFEADNKLSDSLRTNQTVFFSVTDIEFDTASATSLLPSICSRSPLGGLGCWIDPSATRVNQTGINHSRIPNMKNYLAAGGEVCFPSINIIGLRTLPKDTGSSIDLLAKLESFPSSHLLSSRSPFGHLLALSTAAFLPRALDYDLNLSVLVKGKRGIGKVTTAHWVAQRLGIHLYEVK